MATNIVLNNSTIVSGTTSTGIYLVTNINNKQAGIPIYSFTSTTPAIELIDPPTDIKLTNAPIISAGTSYGAGLAVLINNSAYALPMYRIAQNSNITPQLQVNMGTIAIDLTSTGSFLIVKNNEEFYGIPLFTYGTLFYGNSTQTAYTLTTGVSSLSSYSMPYIAVSAISGYNVYQYTSPNTQLSIGPVISDLNALHGSTYLNNKIRTYSQLIRRVKYQLGSPFINLEICEDGQICEFIDMALEMYTKYLGHTEEYLVFSSSLYQEPGLKLDRLFSITPTMRQTMSNGTSACWDYDLGDYRKVAGVFAFEPGETTGINTLFTLEQAMAQQTYFSYMLGNVGFDLVTWEVLKGWLELREKVLAQVPYVDFNAKEQLLRIIPAPNANSRYYGVIGCWVEMPIKDLINELWIQKYVLALTKISIGQVRSKYTSVTFFGGGTINYNDLLQQGLKEKEELEKTLMDGTWQDGFTMPPRFFIG